LEEEELAVVVAAVVVVELEAEGTESNARKLLEG